MSGPSYHGRTHLPGGTDPIPGLSLEGGSSFTPLVEVVSAAGNPLGTTYDDGSGSSYVAGYVYVNWDFPAYASEDENGDYQIGPEDNPEYVFFPLPDTAPFRSLYRFTFTIQGAWQETTDPQHYDVNFYFYRGNVDVPTATVDSWTSQSVSQLAVMTTFDDPLVLAGDYGSDGNKFRSCIVRCSPFPATTHMAIRVQLMQELNGENVFQNSGMACDLYVERIMEHPG